MLFTWPKTLEGLKQALMQKNRPRYRNKAYLDSYKNKICIASDNGFDLCGEPAVGCHIRKGSEGGASMKPDDCLTHPLCTRHHAYQHGMAEEMFILEYVYKPMTRRMFIQWAEKN